MASGEQHVQKTMMLPVPVTLAATWLAAENGSGAVALVAGLAAGAGALSGILLSPDLDIDHKTISENILFRYFGVLGFAFWLFWLPYAIAIPHRHFLSHAPVIGTLGRVLYLCIPFWLFGYEPLSYALVWWAIGGLAVSDLLHWIMDL